MVELTPPTWEYSYVSTTTNSLPTMVESLNNLAVDGWELVTMDDIDRTLGINSLTAMVRRRIEPLRAPDERDEGWYVDPSGRFDKRYWNGRAWTFHVGRQADKAVLRDPPTARPPTPELTQ
jgi:hypothetical protein